ncbi:MAG: hypothetical protein CMH49_03305 [Myxococcales bacterium]|nr:hypothetical protein [Myxococcales bacterium]
MSLAAYSNTVTEPVDRQVKKYGFTRIQLSLLLGISLLFTYTLAYAEKGNDTKPTSLEQEILFLKGPQITSPSEDQKGHQVEFSLWSSTAQKIDNQTTADSLKSWHGEAPRYTIMKLEDPLRIVVDVLATNSNLVDSAFEPLNGPISQVSTIQLGSGQDQVSRLIFTLKKDLDHQIIFEQDKLIFQVKTKQESDPIELAQDRESTNLEPTSNQVGAIWRAERLKVASHPLSIDDQERTEGQNVQLKLAPNDRGVILPTPYVDDSNPKALHLVLNGLSVPRNLEQKLDTSELEGPLKYLSLIREEVDGIYTAHLIAELRHDASHQVHFIEDGDGEYILEWSFSSLSLANQQLAQSMSNQVTASQNSAPTFKSEEGRQARRPSTQRRKKRYLGKRIKINIKDADIHNVLRFLADCGQVNIVTSDEVDGKVTLMLNQVPWDQALDIILRSKGLDMVREGNIIRVAPREAIAAERKAELEKTQIKEQLKPIMIRLITVNHAEGKDMVEQVKGVLSERGSVSFDLRTNTLIIKDIEEHIEAAEDLVKRLDTQTPQVLIEARIVEVNKVNEKELGIQWGGSFNGIVGTGNATGLSFPSSIGLKGAADDIQIIPPGVPAQPNFMINLPATVGVGSGGALGLSLGSVDGAFNLNVRLSAAASRGTVKIVSSPKITTLDNKKALISQGVSIPISQVSAQGVQTVFFDATLSLEVVPHVTQDGNIYLQLLAKNDTPDFQNVGSRGDPTILKKEASTQVLLQDGETTVIGGIYTSNAGYGSTEWPILSQVPIIGALFRKENERSQKNELLIFITPRVINRLASKVNTR